MPPRTTTKDAQDRGGQRARLLERAVQRVLARGLSDGSLRAIAAELDTSHRMLIYHFGSAEQFWDAVLQQLRLRDQQALARATAAGRMPTLEETWQQLTSPRSLSIMRVLFQLYGEALKDRERFATFLTQFVEGWLQTIAAAMQKQHGFDGAAAMLEARLELAIVRGLLLDVITTGDHDGTTAALHEYARRARKRRRSES